MNVSLWNQPQTTIGHLRARYSGSRESIDRTVLRLRVERLLDNVDLRPTGLSSGAMLIVRQLDSPASVDISSLSQPVLLRLQASLRDQLMVLYASAARPPLGAVPLNASSVLFADPGEMLTCLTRDLLNGQADERWYWQQALRNLSRAPESALPVLWSAHAAFLPGVFASLRPSEQYYAINCFTLHTIEGVIHSLHECFDLPSEALAAIVSGKPEGDSFTQAAKPGQATGGEGWTASSPAETLPPWEKWLPTTMLPALSSEARYLLGLGMALHHAPSFARSTRFATKSAVWLQSQHERRSTATEPPRALTEHGSTMEPGQQPIVSPAQGQTGEQIHAILKEQEQEQEQGSTRRNEIDAENSTSAQQTATVTPGAEPSPVALQNKGSLVDSPPAIEAQASVSSSTLDEQLEKPGISPLQEAPLSQVIQETLQQATPPSLFQAVPSGMEATFSQMLAPGIPTATEEHLFVTSASIALPADGVFTRLGGVLYLINLLSKLDLLHSWERDEAFVEYVSGWATIEALARCLLSSGSLHDRYVDDPIWHILALLDGRELGIPITTGGMEMNKDRAFRLPSSWLQHAGPVSWSATQHGERLLISDDAAGFLIADVPLRGRTFFEAAHAEIEAYREQGIELSWSLGSTGVLRGLPRGVFSAGIEDLMPLLTAESLLVYMDEQVLWWLEHVLGFVYNLLARALEVPFDEPGRLARLARLAQLALCHHGQLIASPTHVDLHMSLEESNIALRISGLDRDPAWVPDLARVVYFHFN